MNTISKAVRSQCFWPEVTQHQSLKEITQMRLLSKKTKEKIDVIIQGLYAKAIETYGEKLDLSHCSVSLERLQNRNLFFLYLQNVSTDEAELLCLYNPPLYRFLPEDLRREHKQIKALWLRDPMLDHSPYIPKSLWSNKNLVTLFIDRASIETGSYQIQNPEFFNLKNDTRFFLYLISRNCDPEKVELYFGRDFFSNKDVFLDVLSKVDDSKYDSLEDPDLKTVSFGALFFELKRMVELFDVTVLENEQCAEAIQDVAELLHDKFPWFAEPFKRYLKTSILKKKPLTISAQREIRNLASKVEEDIRFEQHKLNIMNVNAQQLVYIYPENMIEPIRTFRQELIVLNRLSQSIIEDDAVVNDELFHNYNEARNIYHENPRENRIHRELLYPWYPAFIPPEALPSPRQEKIMFLMMAVYVLFMGRMFFKHTKPPTKSPKLP